MYVVYNLHSMSVYSWHGMRRAAEAIADRRNKAIRLQWDVDKAEGKVLARATFKQRYGACSEAEYNNYAIRANVPWSAKTAPQG